MQMHPAVFVEAQIRMKLIAYWNVVNVLSEYAFDNTMYNSLALIFLYGLHADQS